MSAEEDDHLKDLLALLNFGAHKVVEKEDENGVMKRSLEMDPRSIYYTTRLVNTPTLGRAVVKFLELKKLADEARNFMTPKRAAIAKQDLMTRFDNFHYGIDAKSSETVRDKDNNQSSLLHLIRKEHIQREFTAKDPKSQKMLSAWLGKDEEK